MRIPFVKYHGAGNDFILIDDRQLSFPAFQHQLIAALCLPSLGIGSDGLILLQPSSRADFRMRIFNSDGSEPAMCGNGIRCLVAFIQKLTRESSTCAIETGAGVLQCRIKNSAIGIYLGHPRVLFKEHFLEVGGNSFSIDVVDTGVPHGVVFVKDLHAVHFADVARSIRFHPQFSPEGINVNFAQLLPDKSVAVRTYERGAERETLSCGTGAAAVGWLATQKSASSQPIHIRSKEGTLILEVRSCEATGIELWGEAVCVFEGFIQTDRFLGMAQKGAFLGNSCER